MTRLLNDALARHDPTRFAVSASGVELGDAALAPIGQDYRPEPDVMVIDADYEPHQRFVDRAYVIAEVVSDTDNEPVPGEKEPWIARIGFAGSTKNEQITPTHAHPVALPETGGVPVSVAFRGRKKRRATAMARKKRL